MLQSDPSERITIPEIFNHIWVRATNSSQINEMYYYRENQVNHNNLSHGNVLNPNAVMPSVFASDALKAQLANASSNNALDLLIPISPSTVKVSIAIQFIIWSNMLNNCFIFILCFW